MLPKGFAFWLLFLAWLLLGVFVLFADAPGAEPGGGPSRLLVFGYRVAWYLTATVALVWITNLRESELPSRWLYQLLGYMFVVTTVGGLVGVIAPHVEFTSPLEMLLPGGLRNNGLVEAIAHPAVADIQNVLGRPEATTQGAVPVRQLLGQQPLAVPPVLPGRLVLPGPALAEVRRSAGPGPRRHPGDLLAQPRTLGLPRARCRRRGAPPAAKGRAPPIVITGAMLVAITFAFFL